MAKVQLKLNNKGFAELRNSREIRAELDRRASRIAHEAGEGFTRRPAEEGSGPRARARASVIASTYEARLAQSRDNVLQRALNAGRG